MVLMKDICKNFLFEKESPNNFPPTIVMYGVNYNPETIGTTDSISTNFPVNGNYTMEKE